MPPIPKFAKEIAKRAKAKPKVIKTSATVRKVTNTKPKKIDTVRKEKIKKSLEKNLNYKLCETVNILKMNPNDKLSGYKTGEKVKIYNFNNESNYVEIIWPAHSIIKNIVFLTRKQILDGKIKK